MPLIPLNGPLYQNVDEIALVGSSAVLFDGRVDEANCTVRRPGLKTFIDLGTGAQVDGLYWWQAKRVFLTVSAGRVFQIDGPDGAFQELTGAAMQTASRVIFSALANGQSIAAANGGRIHLIPKDGPCMHITDVDAPAQTTHVATVNEYLTALETGSGRVHFNAYNPELLAFDPNYWKSQFINAASSPDNVVAVFNDWGELVLVGESTTEVWEDSGVTLARINGSVTPHGTAAPYSIVQADNGYFMVTHDKRVVQVLQRTPSVIGTPIEKTIQGLYVGDALADNVSVDGLGLYVLNLPLADKTFVYDYILKQWAQWSYYNTETSEHERWLGNCCAVSHPWNLHLVGSRKDGKIYAMSSDYHDDDGNPIRVVRRTGWINQGSDTILKAPSEIVFKFKRGVGRTDGEEPNLTIRWRDNGKQYWSYERNLSAGKTGDTEFYVRLRRDLGSYYSRQYEVVMTDAAPFVLVGAEELF